MAPQTGCLQSLGSHILRKGRSPPEKEGLDVARGRSAEIHVQPSSFLYLLKNWWDVFKRLLTEEPQSLRVRGQTHGVAGGFDEDPFQTE